MIYSLLITAYCLLFTFITWYRFNFALILFFFLLPTYLIRFHIGPLPTTLLEMMFVIIFFVWLFKHTSRNTYYVILDVIKKNKTLFIGILLFLVATIISTLTSSNLKSALGEWKAFYIEPVIIFLILITCCKLQIVKKESIIFALVISGLLTSTLAIYQHFTGWMVPWDFWENANTFRVTAWYGFPNGVGLFLAPIFPLALYGLKQSIIDLKTKDWKKYLFLIPYSLFLILSPIAILYAKSTGALIGLIAGIGLLFLFYKKTRIITIIILASSFLTLILLPQTNPIKQELLLQDRSGQIRLSMWSDTIKFLKDNPILGAGLTSYKEKIIPYHTTVNGECIEIFHHPHNIFLTMWVNLGLLGLISFIIILISMLRSMLRNKSTTFILSSLTIILVIGLVDSPYIKNDLSMFFWLLPALPITQQKK